MIQRFLHFVAGVDRNTLASCPATDKMWATHLGLSLLLSFTVVFGVTFHATGYMIESISTRLLVALVVAMTVLMFDRALCQSDWFSQGSLWSPGSSVQTAAQARQSVWRFMRIAVRLTLSLGLAWVIAMFLELAIFSGTISDKIERDRVAANQPIFDKIGQFEAQLDAEGERRRAKIVELEAAMRTGFTGSSTLDPALAARSEAIDQQLKLIEQREAEIRTELRQIDESVQQYAADMVAEEFGQKLRPTNSGKPGTGPRFEFAKRQRQAFEAQRAVRFADIAQLDARRAQLRDAQSQVAAEAQAIREKERAAFEGQREALQIEINTARAELKQFDATKSERVEELRNRLYTELNYQAKTDASDPLTRIAAYQSLKNDPKDGAIMTLFSWMTRFFIIFLEVVPVVAKIFFSPPSVYAAKIQAEVQRQRRNIVLGAEAADNGSKIAAAAELQAAAEASDFILVPKTLAEQEPFEERRKMNRRVANRRAERPKIVSFRPRSAKTLPSRAVSARA
ncbi:MAG: DUF4407 domain-containing protein [Rhodopseudomonas palustris]|nr:MAG: DUF4407 domain-containing protein [Rhodopseudomonas palustris]